MDKKIEDLRNVLFEQLDRLKKANDNEITKEVQRSSAMVNIATTIIDSSRAETEFLKVANEFQQVPSLGTGFISDGEIKKIS